MSKIRKRGRSYEEKLVDLLLLSYLIIDAYKRKKAIKEETRLQKLVFLAERIMLAKRIKAFNYNFIRLIFGPYSDELRRDLALLLECDILYDDPHKGLVPTEKGLKLMELMKNILSEYREIINIIHDVNEKYADAPLDKLLEYIYNLERPLKGPKISIKNVKIKTPLLRRIPEERAQLTLKIPIEKMKILEVYFDPDVEEVIHERVRGYEVLLLKYKGEVGYTVIVPKLIGCISEGNTREEALKNVSEAIDLYLETLQRDIRDK